MMIVQVKNLVECIEPTPTSTPPPPPLPISITLHKSTDGSPDGKERFVFKYNGARKHEESCLGDAFKKDLIRKLYDASCMEYDLKIKYLESFSCDASRHLECRKVGFEPNRPFAEQSTPIMKCLCPDYRKPETFINESAGYYDPNRNICVLKLGQICKVNPRGHDKRLVWNDFDFDEDGDGTREGIDVVDLRPIPEVQACVEHAFCFIDDNRGLPIPETSRNKCVCEAGYFPGENGECVLGREPTNPMGAWLAFIIFITGLTALIGDALTY
ncbi:putative cryptochrome DASH [Orchesella cincta]|uniref:Putative cryptochrome DASH n=1 Tax=Orchesella cincta TaxID=48709 RepID=A0A1D2NM80_ORCCI|nr:putative cryptochrome DASH [Orchesella cincta]